MYCTIAQAKARNSRILATLSDTTVTEAIQGADSTIDGMIGGRYSVPLSSAPAMIREVSADLAASSLLLQAVGNSGVADASGQSEALYKRAMSDLNDIRTGKTTLTLSDSARQMPCYSSSYGETRHFPDGWDITDPSTYRRT